MGDLQFGCPYEMCCAVWKMINYEYIYIQHKYTGSEPYKCIGGFVDDFNLNRRHQSVNHAVLYMLENGLN